MPSTQNAVNNHEYRSVPITALAESATNPRKRFDVKSLEELAAYVPGHIMQSIFSSAARLRGSMVGKKPGRRAGELKMYWTKPPRWSRRYGH